MPSLDAEWAGVGTPAWMGLDRGLLAASPQQSCTTQPRAQSSTCPPW
ncbi:hypothetical protein WMF38_40995 [Sorangium sp. So ce118]